MGIFQKCKLVVRENDFVEVSRSKGGTAAWFSNTKASMRFCIDGIYKPRNSILGHRPVAAGGPCV
jgi:hypothetical protein